MTEQYRVTKMWIEYRLTNAHAEQLVKDGLSKDFSEKFITGEQYTDIRFGPLEITGAEADKIREALDFIYGLKPKDYKVTTKPF